MSLTFDNYDADSENSEKTLPPASKKRTKSYLVKIQEWGIFESNQGDESDENNSILDKTMLIDSSQWERYSEFEDMISDSIYSDWLP